MATKIDISIKKLNNVYAQIECDQGIANELAEHFTYYVDGYQFSPKYKFGNWDGRIREFNRRNNTIRAGLWREVAQFAKENDYSVEVDRAFGFTEFSIAEAKEFIETLGIPKKYTPREYQVKAFVDAIRCNRGIFISPTASGKSLIQYLIARYYDMKTLILVPTIALVKQMQGDFYDYGYREPMHGIMAGVSHQSKCAIWVSTWQSVFKNDRNFFSQFPVIFADECHLAAAQSICGIMDRSFETPYRFGFTGTLSGSKTSAMCLTGLFGKIHQVTTTAKLMESGDVASLKIKALVLNYPEERRKEVKKMTYQNEILFLINDASRNKFLRNLIGSLEGNTLVFFNRIEHGKIVHDLVKNHYPKKNVYWVSGSTDVEQREYVRKIIEEQDDCIIFGSNVMTTGSNTKSIHNIVFISPGKSKIKVLQSVGRALRKSSKKDAAVLYDIADNLSVPSRKNYTLNHFLERMSIYKEEEFPLKLYNIDLQE